jgi:hypothetical protein
MEQDFAGTLGTWTGFYTALSAIAATLLGLLFVAVSLRLNLFQDAVVADVRDFAALVFGQFLALVLVGLVALVPHPQPATLGLPTLALGALGLGWSVRLAREYLRLNTAPGSRRWWSVAFFIVSLGAALAFVLGGAALLLRQDAVPLPWMAAVDVGTLAVGAVGAWLLLSHAKAG